jgi:hypothetical protein
MSATYRQASHASPQLRERDPENRLLARGPSRRLPAEMVRDNALAASGLLVRTVGGPSVMPYQPARLWEEKAAERSILRNYVQGTGEDLYRRALYTFWKRTSPPPMLATFDGPDREICIIRRQSTNTPLQALNLLNDVQFVEASRMLAERMVREGGADADGRIRLGFRAATARTPTPQEIGVLRSLYENQRASYQINRGGALLLLQSGEHPRDPSLDPVEVAALTIVANTLLNLDEAQTKR